MDVHIQNIARVLVFRAVNGRIFTLGEIEKDYPIVPAGTLDYYGVVDENVEHFRQTGRALNDGHREVLDRLLDALRASPAASMLFELVVEPIEKKNPYRFVAANMALVERLAVELTEYQNQARPSGKRLDMLVRYASEMNDAGGSVYAGHPVRFKKSFIEVRRAFRKRAPQIRFTFSPALRADLNDAKIAQYWPGDRYVDVIGATWYVHGENQRVKGMANMRSYFQRAVRVGKPLAIDEFGGALGESQSDYHGNDIMLESMLREIEMLADTGITFAFGTIFLDDQKYGVDATLDFLKPA